MKPTTRVVALASALALAACNSLPIPIPGPGPSPNQAAQQDPIAQLAAFTVADLQAANADALAQTPPDVTASQCYSYLIKVIPTLQPNLPSGTVGAFVAFQKARDLANGVSSANGALKSLNLACAPLVIDTQTIINRLALIGGGIAATGGAVAPLLGTKKAP